MEIESSVLPTIDVENEDQIDYASHDHPLILCEIDEDCSICGERCLGRRTYGCNQCGLFLHESCTKIDTPQEIDHHFHLHPLRLAMNKRKYSSCEACKKTLPGLIFECQDCYFFMDVECALLPTKLKQDIDHILHFKHPHPLVLCDDEKIYEEKLCTGCGGTLLTHPCFSYGTSSLLEGSESIYKCLHLRCEFFLHECCARLPLKIDSPFHPGHHSLALIWLVSNDPLCRGCLRLPVHRYRYQCPGSCNLSLGLCKFLGSCICVECAFLKAPILKLESYKHCLCELCNKYCDSSSIFKCIDCIYNPHLHSSIKDKCHDHPLKLMYDFVEDGDTVYCDVCEQPRDDPNECVYYCEDCNFIAELKCMGAEVLRSVYGEQGNAKLRAANATRNQVLELDIEEYLILFPSVNSILTCVVCDNICDGSHIFRCIEHDYNLHLHCGPLPCSIKDKCHIHSLKLMNDFVEDGYEDDIVYCDACEQPRDPDECVYYCKDCNFFAELKCVEGEVLRSLNGERGNVKLRTANKTRNRVRAKLISNVVTDNVETDSDNETENETEDMGAKYLEVEEVLHENILSACYTDEECEQLIEIFKKARVQLRPSTSFLEESLFIHWESYNALCAHIERYELAELQSKGKQEFKTSIDEESDNDSRRHLSDPSITGLLSNDFKQLMRNLDSYYEEDELLEVFFHRDDQIVRIGEHKIKPNLAYVLKGLLHKYGDFTAKSKLSERLKLAFLTIFCKVIHGMCRTNAREVEDEVLHKWWKALKLAQLAGFEIEFAIDQLYKVVQASFGVQAISSYGEMKSRVDEISNEIEYDEAQLEAKKRELAELKSRVDEHKYAIEYESSPILKKCLKYVSELKWKKVWDGSLFR